MCVCVCVCVCACVCVCVFTYYSVHNIRLLIGFFEFCVVSLIGSLYLFQIHKHLNKQSDTKTRKNVFSPNVFYYSVFLLFLHFRKPFSKRFFNDTHIYI